MHNVLMLSNDVIDCVELLGDIMLLYVAYII